MVHVAEFVLSHFVLVVILSLLLSRKKENLSKYNASCFDFIPVVGKLQYTAQVFLVGTKKKQNKTEKHLF